MPPATPRTTDGRTPASTEASGPAMSLMVVGWVGSLGSEAGVEGCGLAGLLLGGQLGRVDVLAGQQVVVDLAQGDRERLLLHVGLDERTDVLQEALAELGVVGVDLPRPLGAVEDELVLAVRLG